MVRANLHPVNAPIFSGIRNTPIRCFRGSLLPMELLQSAPLVHVGEQSHDVGHTVARGSIRDLALVRLWRLCGELLRPQSNHSGHHLRQHSKEDAYRN